MRDFVDHKADVLVCTTISESGLDIPNANTIIINQANMFGLAELHQLRGRVGRYKHRAYAYLLLPVDRPITPIAEKRLRAIEEFSDLGAGFRIAMRDLEIRGAGNILGPQQSGHLAAVGYDLYCRLMESAVRKLNNEPVMEPAEVSLNFDTDTFLPADYVTDPTHRIDIYRKIHRAQTSDDLTSLRNEMRDRFGVLPSEVESILTTTRLRQLAQRLNIRHISRQDTDKSAGMSARFPLVIHAVHIGVVSTVLDKTSQAYRVIDDNTLHLRPLEASTKKGATRISGEFMVSFLTNAFERGMPAIPEENEEKPAQ